MRRPWLTVDVSLIETYASVCDNMADTPEQAANLLSRSGLMRQIAAIVKDTHRSCAVLRRQVVQPCLTRRQSQRQGLVQQTAHLADLLSIPVVIILSRRASTIPGPRLLLSPAGAHRVTAQQVVLFVSTQNAARTILAEALMNDLSNGRLRAYSAGREPLGYVEPLALEALKYFKIPSNGFASKSWDAFVTEESVPIDFVVSIGERHSAEFFPRWPGRPLTTRWKAKDPGAIQGPREVRARSYIETALVLRRHVKVLIDAASEANDPATMRS